MARFDSVPPTTLIATSLLAAPGWARVGITMPDRGMRERAADELARAVVAGVGVEPDRDQLTLSL